MFHPVSLCWFFDLVKGGAVTPNDPKIVPRGARAERPLGGRGVGGSWAGMDGAWGRKSSGWIFVKWKHRWWAKIGNPAGGRSARKAVWRGCATLANRGNAALTGTWENRPNDMSKSPNMLVNLIR